MQKKLEIGFKISYLLLVLISFNVFFARHWYIQYLAYAIVAIGVVVGVMRMLHIKDYLNAGVFLLLSFVCSYVLGAVNTFDYGYIDNAKAIVWMAIQYFLIFAFDKKEDNSTERDILFKIIVVYTAVCSFIAIYMLATKWYYNSTVDGNYFVIGGLYGRLYGCYIDPNYGAVLSVISIVISCFYLLQHFYVQIAFKFFLIINLFTELIYIHFSGSRTGFFALIFALIVYSLIICLKNEKYYKHMAIWFLCLSLCIAGVYALLLALQKKGMMYFVGRPLDRLIDGTFFVDGRIDIWKNAIELFKQHPLVGISFRNIFEYATNNIPSSFLGFESMHNFFFDILVSQGIIGVAILFMLMGWVLWTLIKKYKTLTDYREFAFMMAIIAAIFASMLTYSETFYMNTGGAFIFWYVLGYLVNFKEKKEIEEVK